MTKPDKIKITSEGQPCRKCGTPVIKRIPSKKGSNKRAYTYAYYFYCPSCYTMYMVDEAKQKINEEPISAQKLAEEPTISEGVIPHDPKAELPKSTKALKVDWHDRMRSRACLYANEICQNCQKVTPVANGVIHHIKYSVGVYERDVEALMDDNICVWLCKACHQEVHIAGSFDETQSTVKNAGYCHYCGDLAFGGWDRGKTLGLDYCICKKCLKTMRERDKQEREGQLSLF